MDTYRITYTETLVSVVDIPASDLREWGIDPEGDIPAQIVQQEWDAEESANWYDYTLAEYVRKYVETTSSEYEVVKKSDLGGAE